MLERNADRLLAAPIIERGQFAELTQESQEALKRMSEEQRLGVLYIAARRHRENSGEERADTLFRLQVATELQAWAVVERARCGSAGFPRA